MFVRKSVGKGNLIYIFFIINDVCSEGRIQFVIRRAMLVQKGQYIKMYSFTSSFMYLFQDKIIYINIYIHVKQDFNIRIKIYVHVSRSACEYIKSIEINNIKYTV